MTSIDYLLCESVANGCLLNGVFLGGVEVKCCSSLSLEFGICLSCIVYCLQCTRVCLWLRWIPFSTGIHSNVTVANPCPFILSTFFTYRWRSCTPERSSTAWGLVMHELDPCPLLNELAQCMAISGWLWYHLIITDNILSVYLLSCLLPLIHFVARIFVLSLYVHSKLTADSLQSEDKSCLGWAEIIHENCIKCLS